MPSSGPLVWLCVMSALPLGLLAINSPPPNHQPLRKPQPPGEAFLADADYNDRAYGDYVTQTFKSTNVTAPRVNMMKTFMGCDDGSYLFFSPRGEIVNDTTATIYDMSGSLIWKLPDYEYHEVYNFQMQEYRGEPYITFWHGDPSGGHGDGHYYMYDQHYNLARKVNAGNGLTADLHSFVILPNGNALLTTYENVTTDLADVFNRPIARPTYMWDCLFQEVDIESGIVAFQWRASDHFDLSESYTDFSTASDKEPWDFFHLNSVDKDDAGNYLISSRHLRCLAYISGETGEVLWRLGGKRNSFTDLSGGEATHYVGQHDAHFDEGGKFVTFFDNRADWTFELEHVSKGRRIEIDTVAMTAKLSQTYVHPDHIFAFSQGSYQTLPNGNILLGFGFSGAVAEFDRNGTLLCDAFLQPKAKFSSGDVQSYRNLKFNWTGLPDTRPSAVVEESTLYVSWLGSTEVHSWWLQDSTSPGEDGKWAAALIFDKTGFETQIPLGELLLREYIRIVALDAEQQALSISETLYIGDLASVFEPVSEVEAVHDTAETIRLEQRWQDLGALVGFFILACVAGAIVFVMSFRPRLARRWLAPKEQGAKDTYTTEKLGKTAQMWQRVKSAWPTRQSLVEYHVLPQWAVEERRASLADDR